MSVQFLIDVLKSVSLYQDIVFILSFVFLFLILIMFIFLFLKRRNWLTNKKYVIISISVGVFLSVVFTFLIFWFVGFKLGFYNIISILFFAVVLWILKYLSWKRFLSSFYENPRAHIYHKGDWFWVLILGACVLLIFLFAYVFIIP